MPAGRKRKGDEVMLARLGSNLAWERATAGLTQEKLVERVDLHSRSPKNRGRGDESEGDGPFLHSRRSRMPMGASCPASRPLGPIHRRGQPRVSETCRFIEHFACGAKNPAGLLQMLGTRVG